MKTQLTQHERQIANYMIDMNRDALNRISPDCVSPLISLRKVVLRTAQAIGNTELRSERPLTHREWIKITQWIRNTYYQRT